MVPWAGACAACDRQCEAAPKGGLSLCSYGVNFQRFDADLLVAGIVVRDYATCTTARAKRLREARRYTVSAAQVARVLDACSQSVDALSTELRERKNQLIAEYQASEAYKDDIVELMRPDLERSLSHAHDFKQFVQQIVQNISVVLERQFPRIPMEEKLDKASHEEAAIYWAARLMDEKLDAALFLEYPERIHALHERGRFRFHGLVTKYRKIYARRLDAKQLRTEQVGESHGEIEGNSRAIAVIPHALIDNAIKYAPRGSRVRLHFHEADDLLTFAVESYGPVIADHEKARIFELFFRGEAAKALDADGTGFGLASAQNIAMQIGTAVAVDQDTAPGPDGTHRTTFTVSFPLVEPRRRRDDRSRPGRRHDAR